MRLFVPIISMAVTFTAWLGLVAPSLAAPDGAQIYGQCAVCHLKDGAGVPGAYPPLHGNVAALADLPEGRRYLALVVIKGVFGPLVVDGRKYSGMMPPQSGLDDAAVASVLNHIAGASAQSGEASEPFTVAEIEAVREGGASLNAVEVARLRPGLEGK